MRCGPDTALVTRESFPVSVFVSVQRRGGIGRPSGELSREICRAGDGHAGALAEQGDAARRVADEDRPVSRPGIETYAAHGIEVEILAVTDSIEKLGHSPLHAAVGVDHRPLGLAGILITVCRDVVTSPRGVVAM